MIAMAPVKTLGERIADALVEDGLVTPAQVEELLERQKKEGTRFIKLVVEKSYITEQDLAVCMGRVLNTPPVNLPRVNIPPEVTELIPRDAAPNHRVAFTAAEPFQPFNPKFGSPKVAPPEPPEPGKSRLAWAA